MYLLSGSQSFTFCRVNMLYNIFRNHTYLFLTQGYNNILKWMAIE